MFIGPLVPVKIASNVIDYKEQCKLLGVVLDSQLKWKAQIGEISKKFSR